MVRLVNLAEKDLLLAHRSSDYEDCATIMRLKPDILLGLTTVLMAVLGGVVSALPPTDSLQKLDYIAAFGLLGCSGCVLVIMQARKTSKSETELRNGIESLAAQSTEITRLQTSNIELQQHLLELSKLNTSLTRENISAVTGGGSFCWMAVNFQFGYPCPFFSHSGKHPLYEVKVRIVDLNKLQGKIARGETITLSDDIEFPLGEMPVNTGGCAERVPLPFSDDTAQNFNVFFMSRNGRWTEFLRLRKVDDHWSCAIQVAWQFRVDQPVTQDPIFEKVDADYPRNDKGLVDWS